MTKKKNNETQELNEDQLEDVSGGNRILSASINEAEENDEYGWDYGFLPCAEGDDERFRMLK